MLTKKIVSGGGGVGDGWYVRGGGHTHNTRSTEGERADARDGGKKNALPASLDTRRYKRGRCERSTIWRTTYSRANAYCLLSLAPPRTALPNQPGRYESTRFIAILLSHSAFLNEEKHYHRITTVSLNCEIISVSRHPTRFRKTES